MMTKLGTVWVVWMALWIEVQATPEFTCNQTGWVQFKTHCGKSYSGREEDTRKSMFMENCKWVTIHNEMFEKKKASFKTKITCRASDSTLGEIKSMEGYLIEFNKYEATATAGSAPLLQSYDWKTRLPKISGVMDQDGCAASWAIVAVRSIQHQYLIHKGFTKNLSVQELVDCSESYGNKGCNGGRMDNAFKYIMDNGISTAEEYPYTGKVGNCKKNSTRVRVKISGYKTIKEGDVDTVKFLLQTNGTIAACIDSSCWSFWHYFDGLYKEPECSKYDHTMAVLITGHGVENGTEYWICKTTLGTDYGKGGYIFVPIEDNHCGVLSETCIPTI